MPARLTQQGGHMAIAVATVLPRQGNNVLGQGSFTIFPARRRCCIDDIRTMMPVSERWVCGVLGQHRSTQRKAPRGV
jgi:hypothetical protein